MRAARALCCLAILGWCGCSHVGNRHKMLLHVENRSGLALRNLNVDYAAGGFRYASYPPSRQDDRLVGTVRPCVVKLSYETPASAPRTYVFRSDKDCPKRMSLVIDRDLTPRATLDGKPQP